MTIAYDRFIPLATFEHRPEKGPVSVYCAGLAYSIRTSDLRKRAEQWAAEGKVRIVTPSAYDTATARGTMETL